MSVDSDDPSAVVDALHDDDRRIRLVRGGAIVLEAQGFRLLEPRGLRRSPLRPYESLTHVCLAAKSLLVGTTSGLLVIRNADFVDPVAGPAAARERLIGRLAQTPDAARHLLAMARVEALSAQRVRLWSTWLTVALCLLGTAYQLRDPLIDQIGSFVPELFFRGELWRGLTAHFLHALPSEPGLISLLIPGLRGLPVHLAINVGGLVVLGPLVERPLGSWRTAIVLLLGGLGSVAGILLAGHSEVIGASGLVAGLAGAILALELHAPASVPSEWRLPRRLFMVACLVQFGLIDPLFRHYLAGGAHLGGFVGGYAAAFFLAEPDLEPDRPMPRLRLAVLAALVVAVAGTVGIVPLARHDQAALVRHAKRLLNAPPALHLYPHENAAAWFIATEGEPTAEGLELAVALADRAVSTTERLHPGVLDTLAEALFQSGDRLGAILTIDEAISLVPHERYFVEQRRRFTGERDADDRPPPPGSEDGRGSIFADDEELRLVDPDAPRLTI